jgi:hypothetical protein
MSGLVDLFRLILTGLMNSHTNTGDTVSLTATLAYVYKGQETTKGNIYIYGNGLRAPCGLHMGVRNPGGRFGSLKLMAPDRQLIH